MEKQYNTPNDWYKANRSQLKQYQSEWIVVTKEGVIAHDKNYLKLVTVLDKLSDAYLIDRIFENEFCEPVRFLPIRFKTVRHHDWQPKYDVVLTVTHSRPLRMLVDSGADFSLISKQVGLDLGFDIAKTELLGKAQGVGGCVEYVLRNVNMQIDSYSFTAPVAWVQTDGCEEVILGREVVFDLFDIEFKQAEEMILFKKR